MHGRSSIFGQSLEEMPTASFGLIGSFRLIGTQIGHKVRYLLRR
jgi:hypothetical protein